MSARLLKRFFTSQVLKSNLQKIVLDFEESKHLESVLRLKKGDHCLLFDSTGNEWEAEISFLESKKPVVVTLAKQTFEKKSRNFHLTMVQGIPQRGKMDLIVEKAAELGVDLVIPMMSDRTVVKPANDTFGKMKCRWEKIIQAARKQSHSHIPTEVTEPRSFAEILSGVYPKESSFLLDPGAEQNIFDALLKLRSKIAAGEKPKLNVLIGPEGGFTPKEIERAVQAGFTPVRFETPILKTDTAFVAVAGMFLTNANYEKS